MAVCLSCHLQCRVERKTTLCAPCRRALVGIIEEFFDGDPYLPLKIVAPRARQEGTERERKQAMTRQIYCCGCGHDVPARLTDGKEIYPHRPDLAGLPFWICDTCRNYVGCHHKTTDRTRPLGNIPTAELRNARSKIHALLDPLWTSKGMRRSAVYAALSRQLGREYHTAELKDVAEAEKIYKAVLELAKS